jgi:hypothetical protein
MLDAFPSHGRDLALRDRVGGDRRSFHDRLLANGTPPPAIVARRLLPG